ncbi:hypothetical protein ASPCAL01665 [Aspergillus calidoustus]|uniref:Uncharacterized protein n=1 Tax=Aspergillus calidoustus TaxID=454130 RepID=A0A0U5C3B7_ASPCI|nr:hypothetical protein ASPCAL01665 [Aspergillus calidoustus]
MSSTSMSGTVSFTASSITSTWSPAPNELSVVGYYSSGTAVATIVCGDEYEFLVSSTYGVCCPTESAGNCDFRQRCEQSMMVYEDGTTYTCENNNPCVETTMYQAEPSNGWSATMAWCMDADNPTTLYRSFVGTQLTLVPADEDFTTDTDDTTTTTTTRTPTTTTTTSTFITTTTTTPDPAHTDDSNPEDDGPNVGAIAGGVVGGVAGLALILLAAWFILRRQKKKNAELREIGTGYVAPEPK